MDVAVIIGSKGRKTLTETIESLITQTRQPTEIIINLQHQDGPTYKRLNRSIRESESDAFIPLCDDDKLAPTFIEETMAELEKGYECVYTGIQNFGDETGFHLPDKHPFYSSLFTKAVWMELEGYEENVGQYADALFGMKVLKRGKAKLIPKPLYFYRCHSDQETKRLGPEEWDKIKHHFDALN